MSSAEALKENKNQEIEDARPMWRIIFSQFLEHRMAVIGLFVICCFLFVALFAPVISYVVGIKPNDQNVFNRYAPFFSSINASQTDREMALEAFSDNQPEAFEAISQEFVDKGILTDIDTEEVLYEAVATMPPKDIIKALKDFESPGAGELRDIIDNFESFHIFGTDELGRDVFMRLVYGTRVSITVGLLVALASAFIGLIIGSLAGYYGGFLDAALMRVTDSFLALPMIPVLIVLAATDFTKIPVIRHMIPEDGESIFKLIIILCLFSWMTVGRLVRSSTLSIKEREFIQAAKTLGAKDSVVIFTHIFPNVIAPLLVAVTLGVGNAIMFESALSFLGLGIQPPTPTWGNMLFNAQELIYEAPALAILPGILIYLTVVSFNYVGDGLQDAIDPKAIRR